MKDADFYRRQADAYLRRAELAERLMTLADLPSGSVIRWTELGRYTYVAIGIDAEDRWYTTSSLSIGRVLSTQQLFDRLVSAQADVEVVSQWTALADWSDSPDVDTEATQTAETAQTDTDR